MGPKLKVTKDYDLFEFHPLNRPQHKDKVLEMSMGKHGFMPSSPLQFWYVVAGFTGASIEVAMTTAEKGGKA